MFMHRKFTNYSLLYFISIVFKSIRSMNKGIRAIAITIKRIHFTEHFYELYYI